MVNWVSFSDSLDMGTITCLRQRKEKNLITTVPLCGYACMDCFIFFVYVLIFIHGIIVKMLVIFSFKEVEFADQGPFLSIHNVLLALS